MVRRSWKFLETVVAKNKTRPFSPRIVHLRTNTKFRGANNKKNVGGMVQEAFSLVAAAEREGKQPQAAESWP